MTVQRRGFGAAATWLTALLQVCHIAGVSSFIGHRRPLSLRSGSNTAFASSSNQQQLPRGRPQQQQQRRRRQLRRQGAGRVTPRAMFLEEVELRPAAAWVKDQPANRELSSVFALYNSEEVCVCVGKTMDTIGLAKGLLSKHGGEAGHRLRCEVFWAEDADEGMMNMLQKAWLTDVTENQGGSTPVGNADGSWLELDAAAAAAAAGEGEAEAEASKYDALVQEMADSGDSSAALFAAMNAAMARGDEEETSRLMAQIKDAGASMPAADGDL